MKTRRFYLTILLMFAFAGIAFSAGPDANILMRTAASKLSGRAVQATFSISGGISLSGTVKASGNRFTFSGGGNSLWYNGKVMYTYSSSTKEVTIETPSAMDVAQSNPLTYVSGWERNYKATMASRQPANGYCVVLSAKNSKAPATKVVITLGKDYLVRKLVGRTRNGKNFTVNVKSLKFHQGFPTSTFEFPRKKYSKAKIIDLR